MPTGRPMPCEGNREDYHFHGIRFGGKIKLCDWSVRHKGVPKPKQTAVTTTVCFGFGAPLMTNWPITALDFADKPGSREMIIFAIG